MSLRRVCERRLPNTLKTVSWSSPRTHTYAWDQIRRLIPALLPGSSPPEQNRAREGRARADARSLDRYLASNLRIEERELEAGGLN